jgi:hypothetical protein
MQVTRYVPIGGAEMVPDPLGNHVDILDYLQLVKRCDEAARLLKHAVSNDAKWKHDVAFWNSEEIGR